jgi:hypothetical protein
MPRFSILGLMGFVIWSAIGLAALRNASDLWGGIMFQTALAAAGIAALGAVILRDRARSWCGGFAFFGGGYLVLAFAPGFAEQVEPKLATTYLLSYVHARGVEVPAHREALAKYQSERAALAKSLARIQPAARGDDSPLRGAITRRMGEIDQDISASQSALAASNPWRILQSSATEFRHFVLVGHSLFALLAGLMGALVARWLYERRARADRRAASTLDA